MAAEIRRERERKTTHKGFLFFFVFVFEKIFAACHDD
jgi:hypothetical protein